VDPSHLHSWCEAQLQSNTAASLSFIFIRQGTNHRKGERQSILDDKNIQ
jgi:hypothetical protein